MSLLGIGARLAHVPARGPGRPRSWRARFRGLHDFLAHKWYFDELYDRAIVRPTLAFGRLGVGLLRALRDRRHGRGHRVCGARRQHAVRVAQSGCCATTRCCSMTGVTALGLYFLVVSR